MNTITERKISNHPDLNQLYNEAISLLRKLIAIPSFSGSEQETAAEIENFFIKHQISTIRKYNNVWCYNKFYNPEKPTILLNSHHDTVRPNGQYTLNQFNPIMENEKIYGLGSNDAGASLVSLMAVFTYFYDTENLPFNLCLAATAEEENSGENGIKSILNDFKPIAFAIVGEPTGMHMAIAEMGSMVIDCISKGRSGHAARAEGDNAIYKAIKDIEWFSQHKFPIEDNLPVPVKMTVTQINAGLQHNIIPGECSFTVDIRFDHNYTPREILNVIINHTMCTFNVRPNILSPSNIDLLHPLVVNGLNLGRKTYLSPTSSDQGWLDMPSVKMGPGDSARSHTADEFILIDEIEEGITIYIRLLESIFEKTT
ncbi:M20/M25/M40 family metallo-hydrolase [Pedobacter jamesrossensis]|uniref:M20/M25/M40 family metallo-hydrolase n=1 Tax=Pedobacter jamesrossensis TaxID=1908238 RepID=A0ABV8NIA0_9SPHI